MANLTTVSVLCLERLWVVEVDLKSRYRISLNEWMDDDDDDDDDNDDDDDGMVWYGIQVFI